MDGIVNNEFTDKYGHKAYNDLIDLLTNNCDKYRYDACGNDDQCDDEGCMLYKAFNVYLKSMKCTK